MPRNVDPSILRGLQDRDSNDDNTSDRSPLRVYPPVTLPAPAAPLSRLEQLYTARSGLNLEQFGYDVVGVPSSVALAQSGAIQDEYVLGIGDEVVVVLRGQENSTFRTRVDRGGKIVLPKLSPISAAGRSFGDFRADLQARIAQAFVSTSAFVSVGEVRQVSVVVAGEVRAPGVRTVSGLASPLDVILLSGGVRKTGSLRAIRLIRGQTVRSIDLYTLLARGTAAPMGMLQDGDRIVVPPIGATVAVAGSVKRAAIYELPAGVNAIGGKELIRLAGGVEIDGAYRLSKVMLDRDGAARLIPFEQNGVVRSGEVVSVDPVGTNWVGRVGLKGAANLPGPRPLSTSPSVRALLRGDEDLSGNAYTLFALISRLDKLSHARILVPISLYQIFSGGQDVPLQDGDLVFVFSQRELDSIIANDKPPETGSPASVAPPSADQDARTSSGTAPAPSFKPDSADRTNDPRTGGAAGADDPRTDRTPGANYPRTDSAGRSNDPRNVSTSADAPAPSGRVAASEAGAGRNTVTSAEAISIAGELFVTPVELLRVVHEHLVWVVGSVNRPQQYAVTAGIPLHVLIAVAGGAQPGADLSAVEVTSTILDRSSGTSRTNRGLYSFRDFAGVSIQPLDVVRVRGVFSNRLNGRIVVSGEVRYPGAFDIERDEKLSSILERAGGLTEQAYPYGAIFTRRSAAVEERAGNDRAARAIETQLSTLASLSITTQQNTGGANVGSAMAMLKGFAEQLRASPVVGRISVLADPVILAVKPDADILLEPDDTLFIPRRPSTVTVSGEVLNPGPLRYQVSMSPTDYIALAGGATQSADEGRTFVIFPDGSASPLRTNWLAFGRNSIPPGSTVVVPRDLRPFDWTQFATTVSQIVSQLAITAASLAVVGR